MSLKAGNLYLEIEREGKREEQGVHQTAQLDLSWVCERLRDRREIQ
jgi:hypothetical protein